MPKCALWWCPTRKVYAQGLCSAHYHKMLRNRGAVRLNTDSRALLAHIERTNVLLTSLTEQCWRSDGHQRVCRYCNCVEMHAPSCVVVTAQGLLAVQKTETR